MKLFSANIADLRTLYVNNLKKALDMEQTITKALPKLIENATDPELANALENHLGETQGHVAKVQRLLEVNSEDASTEPNKAISGLTTEASNAIKDASDPAVRDIVIIGSAQQVEHHEIAVYGTLRNWAEILGLSDDADVLEAIETEEIRADETLTEIANAVNFQAAI
jgi:ferritin-like metal-binding protein YciE